MACYDYGKNVPMKNVQIDAVDGFGKVRYYLFTSNSIMFLGSLFKHNKKKLKQGIGKSNTTYQYKSTVVSERKKDY